MIRRLPKIQFLLLLAPLLLLGCQQTQNLGSGTAEGFGGGDLLLEQLGEVRNDLLQKGVEDIGAAPTGESLCDFQQYCSIETLGMCASAPTLSQNQKTYCNSFIRSTASDLLASIRNKNIAFEVVNDAIVDDGQPVTARTELAVNGPIWVSYPRVVQSGLSKYELAALIAHEFLHKTKVNNQLLDDNAPMGAFNRASTLFTAVGYAIAFRHQARKNILIAGTAPSKSFMGAGLTAFSATQNPRSIVDETALQISQDFSWSFVVQTTIPQTDLASFTNILFTKGTLQDPIPYGCEIHNHLSVADKGRIECGQKNAGSIFPDTLKTTSRIDDGRPHHIVFSRAGSAMRIYVDGKLDAERILLFPPNNTLNALSLNLGHRNGNSRFTGNLGMFYFWKQSFSPSDIATLNRFMSEVIPGFLSQIFGIR